MSFEPGLRTYLLARAGLTAIIGQRLYPLLVPQSTTTNGNYPAITYQVVSQPNVHSLSGASGLAFPRVQFNCWASTYDDAIAVRDALVDALDGYRGPLGDVTSAACIKIDEGDLLEPFPGTDAQRVYCRRVDFQIWYYEPLPTFA